MIVCGIGRPAARAAPLQKGREQLSTHINLGTGAREGRQNPIRALAEIRRVRNAAGERYRHFLEGNDTAAAQMAHQAPQRSCGVGQIHEDKPTDDGIELARWGKPIDFDGPEAHRSLSSRGGTPARNIDRLRGAVDTHYPAVRAHQPTAQQRYITYAAPHIEHAHAWSDTSTSQDFLRKIAEEGSLLFQSREFRFRIAQWVRAWILRIRSSP
jgi:hypothetical protein